MVSYAAGQAFYFDAATKELQTYAVGYLLQKILYDTKFKIENSGDIKKIVLYSGHDINIAYLLIALGVFDGNFPPYSSYVLLEVHEIDGEYYFKVSIYAKQTLFEIYKQKAYLKVVNLTLCDPLMNVVSQTCDFL